MNHAQETGALGKMDERMKRWREGWMNKWKHGQMEGYEDEGINQVGIIEKMFPEKVEI